MLRTSVCAFVLFSAVELIWAEETVTVKTKDTGAALVNPRMGWTMHFYSNVPRNYGSKLAPSDALDDFPGLSTAYLRIPWAYLEPEEGKYNWALLDTPAQRWIARGKRIALRLTCSENWMKYATPEWVREAGASGTYYQYGKGRVEESNLWDPFFDDPVFLKKLDTFLAAAAERYDGNPDVEFWDVGTLACGARGIPMPAVNRTLSRSRNCISICISNISRTLYSASVMTMPGTTNRANGFQ